MEVFVRI